LQKITAALSKPAAVQAPEPEEIPEEPTPEEAAQIEEVTTPAPLQETTVRTFDNLQDIEEAANSGQVISLMNLHELVNKKQPRQITGTNINEDEAKDRKFLESLPDYTPEAIPEGYTRSEHPLD